MVSYVVSGKNVPTNFKDKGSKAYEKNTDNSCCDRNDVRVRR